MKKAFITGITGQDGSYLAELLLAKGYEVHGVVRRSSIFNIGRISHILIDAQENEEKLFLHYGDITDSGSLRRLIEKVRPDEIYHLAAMSDVKISFEMPTYTANTICLGTLRMLEAIREARLPDVKFYHASSSEMFGKALEIPQRETTPFYPRSPYAAAKVFAHWICKNYRESYHMFVTSGILFNHESPRRGENFVTRKITMGIANILAGKQKKIYLGNLDAQRDWGYAPEYTEAMWRMMQKDTPDDYIIATGETHSVREFIEKAFGYVNLPWQHYVETRKELFRPAEADILLGDASKAKKELGWEPKTKFDDLVFILLEADCKTAGITLKR